ncbi:MAG: hypothetical protein ACK424_02915 [Candidatus Thermochlorobacter sp.]
MEQKVESSVRSVAVAEEEKGFGLINSNWAKNALWDSSMEIAEYLCEENTEAGTETFVETQLTRRYFFSKEFHTISNDTTRKDLYPILSQQVIARRMAKPLPTQTSIWIGVLQNDPFKVARYIVSWQGDGGISNKALLRLTGKSKLVCQNSYCTSGEGEYDLQYDTFFEDQIPLSLRSLNFQENLEFVRPTLVSQLFRGAEAPKYFQGDYKVEGRDTVETKLGKIVCWKVSVEHGMKGNDVYWFEVTSPNILVKAELADGSTRLLQQRSYQRLFP